MGNAVVTFRSKIDGWLLAVLAAVLVLPLVQGAAAFREGSNPIAYLTIFMVLGALLLWLLLTTKYTVEPEFLVVRCGPFKCYIERNEIIQVVPTRSIVASPALSLDRLRVDYARGRKSILISPKDKDGFLKAIAVKSNAIPSGKLPNAA